MQVLLVRTLAMLGSDLTRNAPRACRRIVTALNSALEWLHASRLCQQFIEHVARLPQCAIANTGGALEQHVTEGLALPFAHRCIAADASLPLSPGSNTRLRGSSDFALRICHHQHLVSTRSVFLS